MRPGITVVTPTIPPRRDLLAQAVDSVRAQVLQPVEMVIETDLEHTGAPATRQRGLERVATDWVAFLDDDDWFMPQHLDHLMQHAVETQADYVYSWFETAPPGSDPFPVTHFTQPYDPASPVATTITVLVRTELALGVGFKPHDDANDRWPGEDWRFQMGCQAAGAHITHLVEKTWYWRHWGFGQPGVPGNTSGLGTRW